MSQSHYFPINTTYSIIDPATIAHYVADKFKLISIKECLFWCQGINDTYKIICEHEEYMLRVYRHKWRSNEDIRYEMEALSFIHNKAPKLPGYVAEILSAPDSKETVYEIEAAEGKRYLVLTKWLKGCPIDVNNDAHIALYATTLSRLHNETIRFNSTHQRIELSVETLLTSPYQKIKPYFSIIPNYQPWFSELIEKLTTRYQTLDKNEHNFGFCHGDYQLSNSHVYKEKLSVFDFDCSGEGFRIYDVATFKWYCLTNNIDLSIWESFLNYYLQAQKITQLELNMINDIVMIRQIWTIGLHCETALAKGWLSESYFKFQFDLLKQWQNQDFTSKQFIY
ncbi:phosphotransferase [Psychromonas sp.]|nr:phosphotransferase [Psychromonas sp.]